MHTQGFYDVIDNNIIDKTTGRKIINPAIIIDSELGCVHRIAEKDDIEKTFMSIYEQLNTTDPKYTKHLIVVSYDTESNFVSWNLKDKNRIALDINSACTIFNFITTCGNEAEAIKNILVNDIEIILLYAKNLAERGF